jgi:hypothetical protein
MRDRERLTIPRSAGSFAKRESLGYGQAIPFPHRGRRLLALRAVNDDENFVGAGGWIATQVRVVYTKREHSLANHRTQHIRHVYSSPLNTIKAANDEEATFALTRRRPPIATIAPIVGTSSEHAHVNE